MIVMLMEPNIIVPRILYHIDVMDGQVIPNDFTTNLGLFQRCDPIERDGNTGLRYYFIKEVPDAD